MYVHTNEYLIFHLITQTHKPNKNISTIIMIILTDISGYLNIIFQAWWTT